MNTSATIYCSRCQDMVKPVKAIVIHRCPECGAPFMGYAEHAGGEEAETSQPDHPPREVAFA